MVHTVSSVFQPYFHSVEITLYIYKKNIPFMQWKFFHRSIDLLYFAKISFEVCIGCSL